MDTPTLQAAVGHFSRANPGRHFSRAVKFFAGRANAGVKAPVASDRHVLAIAKVDPQAANEAFGHLKQSLVETEDRNEKAHLLRAVGNAGHTDGLAIAKPYLSSDDSLVRASAADALRLAPQPEASEELAKLARDDPDPYVRSAAVRAIEDRGVSEWSVGVLEYVARNDASGILRSQALSVLSRFASVEPRVTPIVESIVADAKAASET